MALTKITSDVIETGAITSDKLASGAVSASSLSSITTDNVSEGSTNTYFTNARARGAVSVTGGNLTYDSGTGVIQLTTDQIRTAISAGTGVSISAGAISIGQSVATDATPTFGNITTTGYIAGPATFTIDPAAVGDNTGTVVIAGNLQVDGTTTTINSTTMEVDDLNITLASGALNAAAANGAGITVDGASATITYDGTNDEWDFNKGINIAGTVVADSLTVQTVQGDIEIANSGAVIDMQRNSTNYIYASNAAGNLRLGSGGSFNRLNIASNGDISFYEDTGTTAKLFWDASSESLSIGTTGSTTDRRFQISATGPSTATTQFGIVANPTYPTNVTANVYNLYTGPNLTAGTTLTNLYNIYLEANAYTSSTVTNSFGIYQAGANDKNYFAGNVGIGTTSPAYKLDLNGDMRFTTGSALFWGDTNVYEGRTGNDRYWVTGATERMRIDSDGKVLIGATSNAENGRVQVYGNKNLVAGIPQGLLQVSDTDSQAQGVGGGINFTGKYLDNGTHTSFASIEAYKENSTSGNYGASMLFKTRQHGGDQEERMRILSGGEICIGKTSADFNTAGVHIVQGGSVYSGIQTLTASSTYHLRDTTNNTWEFYVTGAGQIHATSTSITSLSDERLKENIKDLETGLNEVMALKPRRFDWKDREEKNVVGFVAQEVETVLPDLVSDFMHDDLEDAKSVKMGDMIPTLVKAIQEQQTIIDDLKSRLDKAGL